MPEPELVDAPAQAAPALFLIPHPLIQAKLTLLREKNTPPPEFRRLLWQASALLFVTATDDLEVEPIAIQTPLAGCEGQRLMHRLVLAPIMRAGLGMLDGIYDLVPEAAVAHIGIYRDETTFLPHCYYSRMPSGLAEADVLVLDPMLATGQSAAAAVTQLKANGAAHLRLLCLLSSPQGIAHFHGVHPDVAIFTASVDEKLDARAFIVPGLGDAGDRCFGT